MFLLVSTNTGWGGGGELHLECWLQLLYKPSWQALGMLLIIHGLPRFICFQLTDWKPDFQKLLLLSHFSRVLLCATSDSSPPGSLVPGILQARILEWVVISFSNAWKWKVKVKSLSRVRPSTTPWTAAFRAPSSMGFSRQEYWSGMPLPSPFQKLPYP